MSLTERKAEMGIERYALGWQKDMPDFRDWNPENKEVKKLIGQSGALKPPKAGIKATCDLSPWCSRIEDQESIGSCTAQAGVGLLEYYERRAFNHHIDASRLFLYKVTRNLLHWTGDTGAWLRTTMKAMVLFGVPPEEYWPYNIARFDDEPSPFCYSFAENYKTIRYFRLDTPGLPTDRLLTRVKQFLAAGYPSMFGFTVYNFGNEDGEFGFPGPSDRVYGGHAVVAVGYDDNRQIGDETGAIKVRNSWGRNWGESGYGWLPYRYVEESLAVDFWSLFKSDYVSAQPFN
jgi:C1A family cysteine protease